MRKAATLACNSCDCTGASQDSCQTLCSRTALLSILYFSTENIKKIYILKRWGLITLIILTASLSVFLSETGFFPALRLCGRDENLTAHGLVPLP